MGVGRGKLSKKRQRERGKRRWREQERYIGVLRQGLTWSAALVAAGRTVGWLNTCCQYDPVFAERVSILDRLNRGGLRSGQRRGRSIRSSPTTPAKVAGQTPRQSQKAYEDLVDLRQKEAFLAMYREGKPRTECASELHVSTIEVLDAMRRDRQFARDIEAIQLARLWDAEDAMYDRAKDSGVDARFLMKRLTEQIDAKAPPKRGSGTGGSGPSWA